MPRKSTTIKARRNSVCPLCFAMVWKNSDSKVYNDGWYHPKCCDELVYAMKKSRELRQPELFV